MRGTGGVECGVGGASPGVAAHAVPVESRGAVETEGCGLGVDVHREEGEEQKESKRDCQHAQI